MCWEKLATGRWLMLYDDIWDFIILMSVILNCCRSRNHPKQHLSFKLQANLDDLSDKKVSLHDLTPYPHPAEHLSINSCKYCTIKLEISVEHVWLLLSSVWSMYIHLSSPFSFRFIRIFNLHHFSRHCTYVEVIAVYTPVFSQVLVI